MAALSRSSTAASRGGCSSRNFQDLIQEIQASFDADDGPTKSEILRPLLEADLLVLDELGSQKPTQFVQDILYYVINTRYNEERATIFTTNYYDRSADAKEETLEQRIGTRLRSRLAEMAERLRVHRRDGPPRGTRCDPEARRLRRPPPRRRQHDRELAADRRSASARCWSFGVFDRGRRVRGARSDSAVTVGIELSQITDSRRRSRTRCSRSSDKWILLVWIFVAVSGAGARLHGHPLVRRGRIGARLRRRESGSPERA